MVTTTCERYLVFVYVARPTVKVCMYGKYKHIED